MPCNGFHSVRSGKEVWATCGTTLRIINTTDLSVAAGIITVANDDINSAQASVTDASANQIQCITGHQNKIWCSLQGCNKLLEYSTLSREKTNVMSLESDGAVFGKGDSITALQVVKDTLWVGKSTGDIVIINITEKLVSLVEEEVEVSAIGVLSLNPILGQPRCYVSQILRGGKDRVAACMQCVDEEMEKRNGGQNGFLVVWESWGSEEFDNFYSYSRW